jgi:hypothetical protein
MKKIFAVMIGILWLAAGTARAQANGSENDQHIRLAGAFKEILSDDGKGKVVSCLPQLADVFIPVDVNAKGPDMTCSLGHKGVGIAVTTYRIHASWVKGLLQDVELNDDPVSTSHKTATCKLSEKVVGESLQKAGFQVMQLPAPPACSYPEKCDGSWRLVDLQNAADTQLYVVSGSEIYSAISDAAGPVLKDESDRLTKQNQAAVAQRISPQQASHIGQGALEMAAQLSNQ